MANMLFLCKLSKIKNHFMMSDLLKYKNRQFEKT